MYSGSAIQLKAITGQEKGFCFLARLRDAIGAVYAKTATKPASAVDPEVWPC
jgi:hypothetical protein